MMSSQYDTFSGWTLSDAASHMSGKESLLQLLLDNRVVAALIEEKTAEIIEILECNRWKTIEIVDWVQSSARDSATRRKLRALRIFPIIHSPDAPFRLAGRNLSDVILSEVFHDPEVQLLAKRLLAEDNLHANTFSDGQYPGYTIDFRWPVALRLENLEYHFAKPYFISLGGPPIVPSPAVKEVAKVLLDRWRALLSLLSNGELTTSGTYVTTGQNTVVRSQQWSRATAWIDVQNGDLLEEVNNDITVRWSGVFLELGKPQRKFHVKPPICDTEPSNTIESVRSRSHKSASVQEAIDALWPNGIPESISAKERNARIIERQKATASSVASARTIERYLKIVAK